MNAFFEMDKNGNGYISHEELKDQILTTIKRRIDAAVFQSMFKLA